MKIRLTLFVFIIISISTITAISFAQRTRDTGDKPITDVKEIQWLSGTDATQRYGTGHGSGAIIVIRK